MDPAKFPTEITQYAGQQVDNGEKARVYANDFIAVHLAGVANGKTYSEVSSLNSAVGSRRHRRAGPNGSAASAST